MIDTKLNHEKELKSISFDEFDRKFTEKKRKTQTKIENKEIYNSVLKLSTTNP